MELAPIDDSTQTANHWFSNEIIDIDASENASSTSDEHKARCVNNDNNDQLTTCTTSKFMYACLFFYVNHDLCFSSF
jgi:hypothetical protein